MTRGVSVTDITPQIEVQTGATLSPGNAIIARGKFFRISEQTGAVLADNTGPIRAYLADSPDSNTPARPSFVVDGVRISADGTWRFQFILDVLPPTAVNAAFSGTGVAYLIFDQHGITRTHVKLVYSNGKASMVR